MTVEIIKMDVPVDAAEIGLVAYFKYFKYKITKIKIVKKKKRMLKHGSGC